MNRDAELDAWRADWRDAAPGPVASARAAERAHWRYRTLAVAEYLAGALLLAGSVAYAAFAGDTTMWAWTATVWVITIPTLVGAVRMRRGLWQAADASVRGFVDLEIRRQHFMLRSARYGFQVLAVTVTANAVWALVVARRDVAVAMRIGIGTLALAAVVAAGLMLYRRQARRGLAALEGLARGLDEPQ
jgi:hypothetical protein